MKKLDVYEPFPDPLTSNDLRALTADLRGQNEHRALRLLSAAASRMSELERELAELRQRRSN